MHRLSPRRVSLTAPRALRVTLAALVYLTAGLSSAQPPQPPGVLDSASGAATLSSWHRLIEHGSSLDEHAKLEAVNRFINRAVTYGEDRDVWGAEEFWATPAQTLGRGMGDCEDFAIAKYFSLVRMGVASAKLRLTFVKSLSRNRAHMVLAYYPSDSAQPLLLDNLDPRIQPASQRNDLLPVYAFNNHGIFLAKAPLQKSTQPPQLLSRWSDVSARALVDGSQAPAEQTLATLSTPG